MKIPEVFPLIFDYEKNIDHREQKYTIIRMVLDMGLASKEDFQSMIENHDNIVTNVSEVLNESKDYVEANLVGIYNYPEILAEYNSILGKYKCFELGQEDDSDDEDYDPCIEEEEEDGDNDNDNDNDNNNDSEGGSGEEDVSNTIEHRSVSSHEITADEEAESDAEEKVIFVEDNTNIKNVERLLKVNVFMSFVCMGVSIANVVALFLKR